MIHWNSAGNFLPSNLYVYFSNSKALICKSTLQENNSINYLQEIKVHHSCVLQLINPKSNEEANFKQRNLLSLMALIKPSLNTHKNSYDVLL
jgi:hypothetical protein